MAGVDRYAPPGTEVDLDTPLIGCPDCGHFSSTNDLAGTGTCHHCGHEVIEEPEGEEGLPSELPAPLHDHDPEG